LNKNNSKPILDFLTLTALIIFLPFIGNINAGTYYVDSKRGDDKLAGTSNKEAWNSIAKINSFLFLPGDSILFRSDCVWREELRISSHGSEKKPIVIGSYGEGRSPKIMGSTCLKSWKRIDSRIWESKLVNDVGWIWFLFKNDEIIWGHKRDDIFHLSNNFDFTFDSTSILIYSETNPNNADLEIEASIRDFGIISGWYQEAKNHIQINNIEICFTKNSNLRSVGSTNWKVESIISHHSGAIDETDGQGIQFEGSNSVFSSNKIYENGQHGIFLSSFGNANVNRNIIEKNEVFNNYHSGIDLMNDGGDEISHRETIIRQNLVYDENTFIGNEVGIQTLGINNGKVLNVRIHHNILVNVNGLGISVVTNSDSIFIHNNTVFETSSACINVDNDYFHAEVFNNIGINNKYYAPLFVHNCLNKKVDYNIWNSDKISWIFIDGEYPKTWLEYINKYNFDKNGDSNKINIKIEGILPILKAEETFEVLIGKYLGYDVDYYGKIKQSIPFIGAVDYKSQN